MPILGAYGVTRVVSSSSARCAQTVKPYAHSAKLPMHKKAALTEETYERSPARAVRQLERALDDGEFVALCTHGPLLPGLLHRLAEQTTEGAARNALTERAIQGMDKGEALICQMVDVGDAARVVSVERNRP